MASTFSVLLCALLGLALWTGTGWVVARRLPFGRALALPMAPALGWAAQNAAALALSLVAGLSLWTMLGAAALLCAAALLMTAPPPAPETPGATRWLYVTAALLALLPAAAVLPKFTADGVILAAPIYDHAKIALVAEIARAGVPPVNPVYGGDGATPGVAYYYLWHFGAAQLARVAGASAWEGDAAATWFTGFASLCLVGGLALRIGGRWMAPLLAVAACGTGSLRPVLALLLGQDLLDRLLRPATGLAGWLFQTSWSPHHVAAACCAVLAALLMARLAARPSGFAALILALTVAAGFGSSLWVGGVVFALAGPPMAVALLVAAEPGRRWRFIACCIAAALLAAALSAPLLAEQLRAADARGGGTPVIIGAFRVLGPAFPDPLRRLLDLPAYWLVLLVIEFPVVFLLGGAALGRWATRREAEREARLPAIAIAVLAVVSFAGGWLLVSTAGENNDLGWRAVLPGVLIVTAAAAAAMSRWLSRGPAWAAAAMIGVAAAALPDAGDIAFNNLTGDPASSAAAFAEAPAMWAALRRHAPPDARVANNPAALADITPWTVNMSWALLADRRSCFAGHELAVAFAPLTAERRTAISELFLRVFAGEGTQDDVTALARRYGCRAVLLTAGDGAWSRDPFAASSLYRLAETAPRWRIYVAAD
ncbi:hypothetical protein [Plastoroseomonas hellenica]|uniref:hypothetical protein n=1 Tax=Plastoroseomonas hellenica TaxID=2687306 RepID=UPI001BA8FE37|nr:hypothetical protein [Plastoroseomonas hellenica]MBR0644661.1 hypothetical protein [Plastoroseomonas hellenica]